MSTAQMGSTLRQTVGPCSRGHSPPLAWKPPEDGFYLPHSLLPRASSIFGSFFKQGRVKHLD